MSRQIRTWHKLNNDETDLPRWDVYINDKPVPHGYVIQRVDGMYEMNYPHLEPRAFDTLEEAQRRIELAPPITKGDLTVAQPAIDEALEDLVDIDEASELLSVSRYRINAMVANGVLAGKRVEGKTFVSRLSIDKKKDTAEQGGKPTGRFAHTFICYYPEATTNTWYLAELSPSDQTSIEEGKRFLQAITQGSIVGKADVLNYHEAMALRAQAKRSFGELPDFARPISVDNLFSLATMKADLVAN